MSKEVYQVTHSSPQITTVGQYVSQIDSPAFKAFKGKEEDFLKVKGLVKDVEVSNKELIERTYNDHELTDNKDKPASEKLLKVGTQLFIPVKDVNVVGLLTQGIEVVSNDFPAFKAKQLLELEADFGYQQVFQPVEGRISRGITKSLLPYVSVWVWCRALSNTFDVNGKPVETMEGSLIDVTPFIQRLDTNVGKNGGNFSFNLPPLVCELLTESDPVTGKVNAKWGLKKGSIQQYNAPSVLDDNKQFVSQNSLIQEDGRKTQFFFHNAISPNDLVFIRFEALRLEKKQRNPNSVIELSKEVLAGNIFDMIGLVDQNPEDSSFEGNDVSINISGRDLMKLILDDGCYFFSLENIAGQFRTAGESQREGELMRRLVSSKASFFLSLYQNNTIENIFKFVIQQLSEISVAPNSLFTSWGDRRNKRFLEKNERTNNVIRNDEILEKEKNLKIELSNEFENDTEDTYNMLNRFVSFILDKKYTVQPNTLSAGWNAFKYGEEIVEKNNYPYEFYTKELVTKEDLSATVFKYLLKVEDIVRLRNTKPKNDDENRDFEKTLARGIWQIIKLVIDKGVSERTIVDSSLSTANGSLVNFFRKVCQEPFVEFFSDTYGDCFYLIARKPPIDRESILSLLKSPVRTVDTQTGQEQEFESSVVDIHAEDVLKTELGFSDSQAYSWYSFKPQNLMVGGNTTIQTVYTPAIFFEEYARIWGSKPLELVHNYNPYYCEYDKDSGVPDVSRYETQAITDMKFMIEGHAYLPFVRSGTIIVNGDRRLKRGNLVRFKPTGEIFHIDSVRQTFISSERNIDRVTVLQVSRGMVESLIYGAEISGKVYSYFNIVNTKFDIKREYHKPKTTKQKQVKEVLNPNYQELPLAVTKVAEVSGKVFFRVESDRARMNKALLKDLEKAAEISGLSFMVTTAITGHSKYTTSGHISRHGAGNAVDIGIINGWSYGDQYIKFTYAATKLTATFESLGYKRNSEKGNPKAVLFGFNDKKLGGNHLNHIHVSNKSNKESSVVQQYGANGEPKYLQEESEVEVTTPGYWGINTEKIYENLKVDKDVFQFFLRKEQMNFDNVRTQTQVSEQNRGKPLKEVVIKNKK